MTARRPTQPKLPLTFHLGTQPLDGCFFLQKPRQQVSFPQPIIGSWGGHVFTLPNYASIRDVLLRMIDEADETVLFASFLLADLHIVEGLLEAAERNYGGVYVLTQLEKDLRPVFHDEEETEVLERYEQHRGLLDRLAKNGVALRSHSEMHAKFCIIDWKTALVTSANAATTSYEENAENGFLIFDSEEVKTLGTVFSNIWRHQAQRECPPTTSGLIVRRVPHPHPKKHLQINPSPREKRTRVIWTFLAEKQQHHLHQELLRLIRAAQEELLIATYSFTDLSADHAIQQALNNALKRGVHIELVLWAKPLRSESQQSLHTLLKNDQLGVLRVLGKHRAHAKSLVSDRTEALLFTGNLDGRHGLTSGIEVGVTTQEPTAVAAIHEFVRFLADSAESQLTPNPTLLDLTRHNFFSLQPRQDPLTIRLTNRALEDFVPRLEQELQSQLVFYQTLSLNGQLLVRLWTEKGRETDSFFLEGALSQRESLVQSGYVVSIDKRNVKKGKDWKPDGFLGPMTVTIEMGESKNKR